MKIVHVVPALTKGGGEKVAVELANHAARAGHEVTLIAGWSVDPTLLFNNVHSDVTILHVADSSVSKVGRYIRLVLWLWQRRLWLADQDILHCHMTYGAIFATLVRILRPKNRPRILETYHAVGMPIPHFKRWFHSRLAVYRDAFILMADDKFWSKFSAAHPKLLTKIIANGISIADTPKISTDQKMQYRDGIGIPKSCKVIIGTLSRMSSDRKPWLYVPIFAEIARVLGSDIHFIIGGDGSELNHVKELVLEYGLEGQVHLPGLVIDPNPAFSIMDLYISLNVGKTTGMAAMEAAASGVPILGIQLYNDYKTGADDWIWSSCSPQQLAEQAIIMIQSPLERKALAERQRAHVTKHHTTEAMAIEYERIYQKMVDYCPTNPSRD